MTGGGAFAGGLMPGATIAISPIRAITRLQYVFASFRNWTHDLLRGNARRRRTVFLADTRTNAGVDHVSAARKMAVFEQPGDRVLVLLAAGNLALTQAVMQLLSEPAPEDKTTLYNVPTMAEAARLVGDAVREVHRRDAATLAEFSVDFNCSFILGGQISGEKKSLFIIYSAGNFVESSQVSPYFQIGESKYGKPIIDRVVTPSTPLDEVAKCALVSMDSTLRSNL